jgi:hypothetical protein
VRAEDHPPHATTLDYIVAAAAGWLTGTFGGAIEARQVSASGDRLVGEADDEVELEGSVLVIKRIHVKLMLRAAEEHRATAEKVHGILAQACPVYRSLIGAIAITTELMFEPVDAGTWPSVPPRWGRSPGTRPPRSLFGLPGRRRAVASGADRQPALSASVLFARCGDACAEDRIVAELRRAIIETRTREKG